MSNIDIEPQALQALSTLAEEQGVPPETYLKALLNYAWSRHRRPGSWEADIPFDFRHYDDRRSDAFADRWF